MFSGFPRWLGFVQRRGLQSGAFGFFFGSLISLSREVMNAWFVSRVHCGNGPIDLGFTETGQTRRLGIITHGAGRDVRFYAACFNVGYHYVAVKDERSTK